LGNQIFEFNETLIGAGLSIEGINLLGGLIGLLFILIIKEFFKKQEEGAL